jgi:predicted nucleic acid-binding protein
LLSLIDTNILVYRFDPRFPDKQRIATELLRRGIADRSVRVPHQAIIEFVAATTRRRGVSEPLLSAADAHREAEELLAQFEILYPTEAVVRMAIRGAAAYRLNWFDANLWAYAEQFGLDEILSEDFEHGRLYGSVKAHNPFPAMS